MADPYVYPGTDVLINKEGFRDRADLASFERAMTLQRMSEGTPAVGLSTAGYRMLDRHLFRDVYGWAGRCRTVNIAKGGQMFCLVPHIASQMEQRFALIRAETWKALSRDELAGRAAEHVCEINAVHPFRDGNGRTQRAFLERLSGRAGNPIELRRMDPNAWIDASIDSFRNASYDYMRRVILDCLPSDVGTSKGAGHVGT
jgi:cell filamentation protein